MAICCGIGVCAVDAMNEPGGGDRGPGGGLALCTGGGGLRLIPGYASCCVWGICSPGTALGCTLTGMPAAGNGVGIVFISTGSSTRDVPQQDMLANSSLVVA